MWQVSESRPRSMGPRSRLCPLRRSLWGTVPYQFSSAATHVSNGMSTIRRNVVAICGAWEGGLRYSEKSKDRVTSCS